MASDLEAGSSPTALHSSSNNLNRRSLSIFSRRGAETPTLATQTLAMASMSMAFANPPTANQPSKQKRWRLSKDMKVPEGTILRMVPKDAPVVEMTPLEREMATSPNEEILRSIGMSGPESAPISPIQAFSSTPLADITNTSPRRYYSTKRERKNSQSDVIGVWRNGRTQWELLGGSGTENDGRPKTACETDTGSENTFATPKTDKPKIQVIIPNNPSARRPFSFVPFFSRSVSEPTSKGIIVSHTISQDISPPSVTSGQSMDSFQISAISPPTIVYKPIPRRSYIPITTTIDESPAFDQNLGPERPSNEPNQSLSSSSSSGSDEEDNISQTRSSRSSMTSIGEHPTEAFHVKQGGDRSRRGSSSPVALFKHGEDLEYNNKKAPLGTPSTPPAQTSASPIADGLHMADFIDMMRSPSMQRPRSKKRISSSRRTLKLARIDSKEELRTSGLASPTLSEAERSLEAQLSDISQEWRQQQQLCMSSPIPEILLSPADAPPPPPRRSSKRKAKKAPVPEVSSKAFSATVEATQRARKIRQQQVAINQQAAIAQSKLRRTNSVRSILSLVCEDEEILPVDADAAETVVYHMLNGVQSLQDLFNTAVITKGFYRVFKVHELDLIRGVLQTQSPAAWEHREICRPTDDDEDSLYSAAPLEDYTPQSYIQSYKADVQVIRSLKDLLSERCQNLLRTDTIAQLSSESSFTSSPRVDSALWRIWSFCKIFGCDKGREDDLVAQMDWLRGGVLAHQDSCSSTISTSDSFYISSVLLGAPDHFAKGNNGGLNAEELYDMLEMWNCLNSITGSITGETEQARQFGVFDNSNIQGGDIDGEEDMLEEWNHYILTLGLSPAVKLATAVRNDPPSAFAFARQQGWTQWTPPAIRGSRKNFVHEAVSRVYEEKICETFSPEQSQRQEMRSIRRSRVPSFHSEIQPRKLSASISVRTCASERPASGWENLNFPNHHNSFDAESSSPTTVVRRVHTIARKPVRPSAPPPPQRAAPMLPPSPPLSHSSFSTPPTQHPFFQPQEDGSWLGAGEDLPAYSGRPASWDQHPLQRAMNDEDPGANSAEKAVFRIVEMGFTHEEAKGALKITDMGDGLRVDRAVEFLLRSKMQAF